MKFTNTQEAPICIGIDHGFGNCKTANSVFRTGVTAYDKEPTFTNNLLEYDGRYYLIGEEHKEYRADMVQDLDYYILTLAVIAKELNHRRLTSATVQLAVGLPLTWVDEQKEAFRNYLLQNETADFRFKGTSYHVTFAGADVFPQGFAAVADKLSSFKGINMLCDIGNGTMNVMYINDRRPQGTRCFTDKYGTHQCILAVRKSLMQQFHKEIDEFLIEHAIRFGKADISERYMTAIHEAAGKYAQGIFRRLRECGYDPELMRLHVVGGGVCIIKNFCEYDAERVTIYEDICATAKGFEFLEAQLMKKRGGHG